MAIQLLFFAALRDATGHTELLASLPTDVSDVAALRKWIAERFANLAERLPSVRFAVNEVFVTDDHALLDGDVVALIPPVSGG